MSNYKFVTLVLLAASLFGQGLRASNGNLPDVIMVQRAALDYARIRPEDLSNLKKRTRTSALLPTFQLATKRTYINKIDVSVSDNVSVTSAGTNIGPESSSAQQNTDDNTVLEVKAVWSLSDLIYNRDMLDIAEEARLQMRDRRALVTDINRLYFELERTIKNGSADPIRREELVADLDALTGGWFSQQLQK